MQNQELLCKEILHLKNATWHVKTQSLHQSILSSGVWQQQRCLKPKQVISVKTKVSQKRLRTWSRFRLRPFRPVSVIESSNREAKLSLTAITECQVVDLDQTFRLPVQRSLSRSPEGWQAPAKGSCAFSSTTSPTSAPPKASRASSSQRSATNQLSTGFVRKK